MSRGRLIASLNSRRKGLIDISLPNESLRSFDIIEIYGASNIDDSFNSPRKILEARVGSTFVSPFASKIHAPIDESNRAITRIFFNLDEYSTTPKALTTRIPTDEEVCYIRIRGRIKGTNQFSDFGPIVVIPPYDFYSLPNPVITMVGTCPNIGTAIPDSLGVGALNIHLPNFTSNFNLKNLSAVAAEDILFTCSPGMTPSVVPPIEDFVLNSSTVGEFFIGGLNSTPKFTLRCAITNMG